MATYFARKSGNINATDVWSTTPSGSAGDYFGSFTSNDTLMANSFTVTINVNTTVLEIRADTTGGATAGGSFTLSNSVTLTANVYGGSTNNLCLTYSGNSPNSATIVGNIVGGVATATGGAVRSAGTGTLNITGNVTGASGSNGYGIEFISNAGTVNITGNVVGGSASTASGISATVSGCICNITGNVTGGSGTNSFGITSVSPSTITVVGTATGGSVAAALNIAGTATIRRAKGNGFGNGSVGLSSVVGVAASQTSTTRVYEIEYGDLGQSPTSGPIIFVNDSSNKALFYRPNLTKKTLVDSAASLDLPVASNVRSGTSYNFGSNTGTCVIPPASSVAFGVAVDNTSGTATLTPQSIWDMLTSNISASNSIGERLKNSATIDSVASQVITIKGA